MNKSSSRLMFFVLCILVGPRTTEQENIIGYACVSKQGSYSANSTYQNNLYTLLASLISNHDFNAGFNSSSLGENHDKVYTTGLCRGYVKPDDGRNCFNYCARDLTQLCPNQNEAIGWYEKCTFRYSNRSLSGIVETDPFLDEVNEQKALLDVGQFNIKLMALSENLRSRAMAGGTSSKYYAVGNVTIPNYLKMAYELVQCAPDLIGPDCDSCIAMAFRILQKCCYGSLGVYLAFPSCIINYGLNRFYDPTADVSINQLPPPTNNTSARKCCCCCSSSLSSSGEGVTS